MKKVASAFVFLQSGLRCCLSAVVPVQAVAHPKHAFLRLDKFRFETEDEGAPKVRARGQEEDEETKEEKDNWWKTATGQDPKGVEAHFGDTECPCIGFDGREGTIRVNYSKTVRVTYPADLGSRCEPWEATRHPSCLPGGDPGPGKGWCAESWCFVDPCNCKTKVVPEPSDMAPDTTFRGKPLYYSYEACGSKNFWNNKPLSLGKPNCRCVGFDNFPGTTEVDWKDPNTSVVTTIEYPADMGGTCRKWDNNVHPMCKGEGEKPKWCSERWCYVDPCSCDLGEMPRVTMYQPHATYRGKSLFYSYGTCGSEDYFTKTLNLEACVNQPTQEKCLRLTVRNGIQKCAWTGSECLGAELVSHPLCKHLDLEGVMQARGRRATCMSAFAFGSALLLGLGLIQS